MNRPAQAGRFALGLAGVDGGTVQLDCVAMHGRAGGDRRLDGNSPCDTAP